MIGFCVERKREREGENVNAYKQSYMHEYCNKYDICTHIFGRRMYLQKRLALIQNEWSIIPREEYKLLRNIGSSDKLAKEKFLHRSSL